MKKLNNLIAITGLVFLLSRCVNDKTTEITPTVKSNVSFQLDIQPILNQECIMCHSPMMGRDPNLQSGFAYNSLMSGDGITPGDSEGSELMEMLHGGGDNPMPPGYKISPTKIALIAKWIDEGAKNN